MLQKTLHSQKGIAQVLLLILILVGLGLGLFLVQRQTALKSHASVTDPENSISMVGYFGEPRQAVPIENPEVNVYADTAFGIDILVKTNPDAINTVSAKIKFDPGTFKIESVKYVEPEARSVFSIIKNWIETSFDNTKGQIDLTGGIPNPGYTNPPAEAGFVTRIILRANPGTIGRTSTIEFLEDGTSLYKNSDSQPVPQVIKRSLLVHIGTEKMGPVTEGGISKPIPGPVGPTPPVPTEPSVSYSLVSGWNNIGVPVVTSLSPKQLLEATGNKCDQLVSFDTAKGGAETYLSDPSKAILNNMDKIIAGRGYQLHCNAETNLTLSGPALTTMPIPQKEYQWVSIPKGRAMSAAELLNAMSINDFDCKTAIRRKGEEDLVYRRGVTGTGFPVVDTEGYIVYCLAAVKPSPTICAQVITPAINPTQKQCKDFGNSCVPEGWIALKGIESCDKAGDLARDGKFVKGRNFSIMFAKFKNPDGSVPGGWELADLNGDKTVNSMDVLLLRAIFIAKGLVKE